MDMFEMFEGLINEVIVENKECGYIPSDYDITSESYGWNIRDRETGQEMDIRLEII